MEHERLSDEEITRIEERMAQALAALEEFFRAVQANSDFADQVRSRGAAVREAIAEARGEVPRLVQDWRHLRDRIVELRRELDRLEATVGELARALEDEAWPASS